MRSLLRVLPLLVLASLAAFVGCTSETDRPGSIVVPTQGTAATEPGRDPGLDEDPAQGGDQGSPYTPYAP